MSWKCSRNSNTRAAAISRSVPAGTDEAEELEVSILKSVEENGEDILVTIDDEEELENVYQALMDLIYEDEEEES